MTENEIRASSRFYEWGVFLSLIVFFTTLFTPNGPGQILNIGAMVGMLGFMIASIRVSRRLSQITLYNRGLPDHCLKCGERLNSKVSGRCPACMKVITPGDVQGDPARRPRAKDG